MGKHGKGRLGRSRKKSTKKRKTAERGHAWAGEDGPRPRQVERPKPGKSESDHDLQQSSPETPGEDKGILDRKSTRSAIAFVYLYIYGADEPSAWGGQGGTIALIKRYLNLPHGSSNVVKRVLERAWECVSNGEAYGETLSRRPYNRKRARTCLYTPRAFSRALLLHRRLDCAL